MTVRTSFYQFCKSPDTEPLTESQASARGVLLEWQEKQFIFSSSSFDFKYYPLDKLDLYMAVASYNYTLSIFKKNGVLYSKVTFWDEYDFEPNNYWSWVADTLNYLWNYYEKNLNGTPYNWTAEIIKPLN